MLAYPVRLVPHGENEIMLIFPDVPEACVVADGEEEAFAVAGTSPKNSWRTMCSTAGRSLRRRELAERRRWARIGTAS